MHHSKLNFSRNNFDLIRLFAAIQVVLLHGANHLDLNLGFFAMLKYFPGVPIFFVVSGFLISASYERSPNLWQYSLNRILRIYPGLWVCFAVTMMIVLSFGVYFNFRDFIVWILAQVSFFQFYNPEFLRTFGVGVINGSLWTIPVELQFYALFPILCVFIRKITKKDINNGGIISSFLVFFIFSCIFSCFDRNDGLWVRLLGITAFPYFFLFLFGWMLQRNFVKLGKFIHGRGVWWLSFYILFLILVKLLDVNFSFLPILFNLILGMVAISFSYTKPNLAEKILGRADISYGVYIYHMLFVNMLLVYGMKGSWLGYVILILVTFFVAFLSWKFVEKPCLSLKRVSIHKLK